MNNNLASINPELPPSEGVFRREVLDKIPHTMEDHDGIEFSPRKVALEAFRRGVAKKRGGSPVELTPEPTIDDVGPKDRVIRPDDLQPYNPEQPNIN